MRAGLQTTGYMNSLHPLPDCQFVAFLTAPRRMLRHLLRTRQAATGLIKPVSQRSPARKVQFRAREARGRICISRHPTRPGFICILGTERTRFASWPQSLHVHVVYIRCLPASQQNNMALQGQQNKMALQGQQNKMALKRQLLTNSKTRWRSRCNKLR